MVEAFVTGVVAGLAVAMPLGAIGLLVVQTGATRGLRPGLEAAAGVATADLAYSAVAATGGAAIAAVLRPHLGTLRVVGASALLAAAAYGLVRAQRRTGDAPAPRAATGRTYAGFVGLTLLNPLTVVTFAGVVIALPSSTLTGSARRVAFVAAVGLASLVWQVGLAAVGAVVGARLPRRWQTATSVAGSLAIAALAGAALLL